MQSWGIKKIITIKNVTAVEDKIVKNLDGFKIYQEGSQ